MAVSPMMQQYLRIKEQYKDAILFFRLATFMKCSSKTPSSSPENWNLR